MEQDNTAETSGDGGFTPAPLADILRSDPAPEPREPAGRQATEEPAAAVAETGEAPADQPRDGRPRDEHGRFAPKEGQQAETGPPPAEQTAPQHVPVAAVLEERRKRQALEAELKELRARVTAPPPPQTQPAAQPEIPLEDLMFQDPQRFIQAVRAPLEQQLVETRLAMSEANARRAPDYAEAEGAFLAYVESNPSIKAQVGEELRRNPDPAGWALEQGRAILAQQRWGAVIQQYGSPEAFVAAQRQQQLAAQPSSVPPNAPPASLASDRSSGARAAPAWNGPTPSSIVFGARR